MTYKNLPYMSSTFNPELSEDSNRKTYPRRKPYTRESKAKYLLTYIFNKGKNYI